MSKKYLHITSKRVIDWCRKNEIGMLIIGHNEHWKQGIKGWPFNPVMLDPLQMNNIVSDL